MQPELLNEVLAYLPTDLGKRFLAALEPAWQRRARRLEARDRAIRSALALIGGKGTVTAVTLERELRRHLAGGPCSVSGLREHLQAIAELNDGGGLRWRRLYDIAKETG